MSESNSKSQLLGSQIEGYTQKLEKLEGELKILEQKSRNLIAENSSLKSEFEASKIRAKADLNEKNEIIIALQVFRFLYLFTLNCKLFSKG